MASLVAAAVSVYAQTPTAADFAACNTQARAAKGFARSTAGNVSGSVNELTDGTVRSVDAATRSGMAPYRKSRFRRFCQ